MASESLPSDRGLQQLIGAALIDGDVRAALMRNPLSLANRFELSLPERRFIVHAHPRSVEHFATLVEKWVGNWPPLDRWPVKAQPEIAQLAG